MTRGDVLAIAVAAAFVGALYAHSWQPRIFASHFDLRIEGAEAVRHPLTPDREIRVEGRQGPITLKVEQGRVRFLASSCRNQVCVHSGWLSHAGDSAACLPNRISMTLGGEVADRLDAVSF